MKKILLLCTLFIYSFSYGQELNISVSGHVTNSDGTPMENILVTAFADMPTDPFLLSFTDSVGYYYFEFENAIPNGCAIVEIQNCDFSILLEERCWEGEEEDYTVDFVYCENGFVDSLCMVWTYENFTATGAVEIAAIAAGVAPFQYSWSTGSTDPMILVTEEGEYCVVVTAADGCVSTACHILEFPSECESYIYVDYGFNEATLGVDSWGEAPFNYQWSTGETDELITVDETAEYCVTITDANDCEDVNCLFVDIQQDSFCFSWIYETQDSTTGGGMNALFVEAFGLAPYTYEWSNGETGPSILLGDAGTYCVTVTDATGCVSESCYTVWGECGVFVNCDPVPGGIFLFSDAWGAWPITYIWSTGDTTDVIQIFDEGEYCVTITDANDCSSETCFYADPTNNPFDSTCVVFVYEEFTSTGVALIAESFGIPGVEYEWSTGEAGQSILVEEEGEYCVTAVFPNACVATECYYYFPVEDCGVFTSCDPNDDGSTTFVPFPWGEAPFTYLWSTGDTTETLLVDQEGEYCVTVTDATGCEAETCSYFTPFIFQDSCFSFILTELVDEEEILLTADGFGVEPFTYEWNTGDDTESITVNEEGTYCVVVIDANGCFNESCVTIGDDLTGIGNPEDDISTIFGFLLGVEDQLDAIVVLYQQLNDGSYEAIDSSFSVGEFFIYAFDNLDPGNYLTKAIVNGGDYMPTYHESSLLWDEANIIEVETGDIVQADIFVIPGNESNGPGMVSGSVTEADGFYNDDSFSGRSGEPVVGVSILILTDQNVPISHTKTDESGLFEFDNLAFGTYKILIEEAGKNHSIQWFTISPENTIQTVSFKLDDMGSFVSAVDELESIDQIRLRTNPVTQLLQIDLDVKQSQNIQIQLIDLMAKIHYNDSRLIGQGNHTLNLDVTSLMPGNYFTRILTDEGSKTFKFIKI